MKPNIAVLLFDTLRADHLSCYGYDRETTPFIDSVAADSSVYERAFSNSIWSLPAYASLFTGSHPSEHGAVDWGKQVERNSLVRAVNDMGYQSYAACPHLLSGEFGLVDAFQNSDWVSVSSRDFPYEDDPVVEGMEKQAQAGGWDSNAEKIKQFLQLTAKHRSLKPFANGLHYTVQQFKDSRGWWEDNGAEEVFTKSEAFMDSSAEPFFLFANFIEPHGPYKPPREYIREYVGDDVSISEMIDAFDADIKNTMAGNEEISDRQRQIMVDLYDAEIAYIDDQVRQFYQHLEDSGLRDNTVVIMLSDHGDLFGEQGLWGHQGRIHPSLANVPLIIDYPWADGDVESGPVSLRDLYGHITSLADGEETVLDSKGEAFIEYHGWDTQLLIEPWSEYEAIERDYWGVYQSAVVTEDSLFVWDASDNTGLFDLEEGQPFPEAPTEATPEEVDRFQSDIERELGTPQERNDAYREDGRGDGVSDSSLEEQLEHLGYK